MKEKNVDLLDENDFEEMKKLGITDDEIETLQNANAIYATVQMLPPEKQMAKFLIQVKEMFANKDVGKELMDFLTLAEKDPETFIKVFALMEVMDIAEAKPKETSKVEKVTLTQIKDYNDAEVKDKVDKFVNSYAKLSPEDKEIIVDIMKKMN